MTGSDNQRIVEEFRAFAKEFEKETDRAAVILGAAKLDLLLCQILTKVLLPNPSSNDDLLDGDSPLSTFSARIKTVHRLGLISNGFARALHLVRKIRNSFAHELSSARLDSGFHFDRIRDLSDSFKEHDVFFNIQKRFFRKVPEGTPADFRTVVAILAFRLQTVLNRKGVVYCDSPVSEIPSALSIPKHKRKRAGPKR